MPVDGPETTAGFAIAQTIWLSDYTPLQPGYFGEEQTMFTYESNPPFGIELAKCNSKPCGEGEVAEVLELGSEYDLNSGWYFMRTTSGAHST